MHQVATKLQDGISLPISLKYSLGALLTQETRQAKLHKQNIQNNKYLVTGPKQQICIYIYITYVYIYTHVHMTHISFSLLYTFYYCHLYNHINHSILDFTNHPKPSPVPPGLSLQGPKLGALQLLLQALEPYLRRSMGVSHRQKGLGKSWEDHGKIWNMGKYGKST